jgi:hypothetical protein
MTLGDIRVSAIGARTQVGTYLQLLYQAVARREVEAHLILSVWFSVIVSDTSEVRYALRDVTDRLCKLVLVLRGQHDSWTKNIRMAQVAVESHGTVHRHNSALRTSLPLAQDR